MRKAIWISGRPRPYSIFAIGPGRNLKTDNLKVWQAKVSNAVERVVRDDAFQVGLIRMDLVFCFTRKTQKELEWHAKRPDFDNLRKSVQDACKNIIPDDSNIVLGTTLKIYTPEKQGVLIILDSRPGTVTEELESLGVDAGYFEES